LADEGRLSSRSRQGQNEMLSGNPLLERAWRCKEGFVDIWRSENQDVARLRFEKWRQSIPPDIARHSTTLLRAISFWREPLIESYGASILDGYHYAGARLLIHLGSMTERYSFSRLKYKAVMSSVFLDDRLAVCEFCLGAFKQQDILAVHGLSRQPPDDAQRRSRKRSLVRICANCHRLV
jgi:hypothetical protein